MVTNITRAKKLDALIVLGKNHNIGWGKDEIAKDKFFLSPYSKMNVLAAGALFVRGLTDILIFSGGSTSGEDILSEAEAMKQYLRTRFSSAEIPDRKIILEGRSINTRENAKYVSLIVKEYKYKKIGLLTLGFHSKRAARFFKNEGMNVSVLHAEDIIREYVKVYKPFVSKYMNSQNARLENMKENIQRKVIFIDRSNLLFGAITKITRTGLLQN